VAIELGPDRTIELKKFAFPRAPEVPKGWIVERSSSWSRYRNLPVHSGPFDAARIEQTERLLGGIPSRDRYAFYWKEGRPEETSNPRSFECECLRHGGPSEVFELPLLLPLGNIPTNPALSVEVSATNLTAPVRKEIQVSVNVQPADATESATAEIDRHLPPTPKLDRQDLP
jgi:hypothetical protein